MRLSHLADYAVVLMTAAARRPAGARLSATELAAETGVPLPTTQKLMGVLATCDLLSSVRGAGGGFALARPAASISLADIVEAVEGPIAMSACSRVSTSGGEKRMVLGPAPSSSSPRAPARYSRTADTTSSTIRADV